MHSHLYRDGIAQWILVAALVPLPMAHNTSAPFRAHDHAHPPGQASVVLCERFESVIGADPSAAMLATARQNVNARLEFVQSIAEQLTFLPDESVDLVTAGKGHFFQETE